MNDATNLPDDDRDLRLARHLGAPSSEPPPALDAEDQTLLEALEAYRNEAHPPTEPVASDRLWQHITASAGLSGAGSSGRRHHDRPGNSAPRLRLVQMRHPVIWSAAAVLALLIAFGWLFVLQGPAPPELVAGAAEEPLAYETPEGSTITLRPHSALYALDVDPGLVAYQLEGEALFEVVSAPERRFVVEAGAGRVTVLGTTFTVSTWGEQVAVYLDEGRVLFAERSGDGSVLLAPGQTAVLQGDTLRAPTAADRGDYLDWMEGVLVFTRRPAALVSAELSHHFGVTLTLPPSVRSETLSGQVLLDDQDTALRDLGTVLGGHFERSAPNAYRFVPSDR